MLSGGCPGLGYCWGYGYLAVSGQGQGLVRGPFHARFHRMKWLIIPMWFWTGAALAQDAPVTVSPARMLALAEAPGWVGMQCWRDWQGIWPGFALMPCGWTQGLCRMTRIYGH